MSLTATHPYSPAPYPGIPTKKAVIIMGFGCEGRTPIFESQYPQRQSIFKIGKPPAGFEEVSLTAAPQSAGESGKEVKLTWESTVRNVDRFEVQMSLDGGAHFQTIGLVSESGFTWHVPDGFSGEPVFRIIAYRSDGTSLESLMRSERYRNLHGSVNCQFALVPSPPTPATSQPSNLLTPTFTAHRPGPQSYSAP